MLKIDVCMWPLNAKSFYHGLILFVSKEHQLRVKKISKNHMISLKKNGKMNFSKKSHFLKNLFRFKARYKKILRSTQCILQVGMTIIKKNFFKSVQY